VPSDHWSIAPIWRYLFYNILSFLVLRIIDLFFMWAFGTVGVLEPMLYGITSSIWAGHITYIVVKGKNGTFVYGAILYFSTNLLIFIGRLLFLYLQKERDNQQRITRHKIRAWKSYIVNVIGSSYILIIISKILGYYKGYAALWLPPFVLCCIIGFTVSILALSVLFNQDYGTFLMLAFIFFTVFDASYLLYYMESFWEKGERRTAYIIFFYIISLLSTILSCTGLFNKIRGMSNTRRQLLILSGVDEEDIKIKKSEESDKMKGLGLISSNFFGIGGKEGGSSTEDSNKCYICYINDPESCYLPCKHGGVCKECAFQYFKRKQQCPVCRSEVESVVFYEVTDQGKFRQIEEMRIGE